jgi:DNA-directed RNA polymerase subunit RPC12/RpoP
MKYIDHSSTQELVCPHCGFKFSDSWEWTGDDGDDECLECGKTFFWERMVEITYSTSIKKEDL